MSCNCVKIVTYLTCVACHTLLTVRHKKNTDAILHAEKWNKKCKNCQGTKFVYKEYTPTV